MSDYASASVRWEAQSLLARSEHGLRQKSPFCVKALLLRHCHESPESHNCPGLPRISRIEAEKFVTPGTSSYARHRLQDLQRRRTGHDAAAAQNETATADTARLDTPARLGGDLVFARPDKRKRIDAPR